ncbi:hypothetical protein [Roseitranquillus sediminis]|uniref:hypothetical protein n=1 Tax=Roseitranquillus sediminis TaxID=2809051 RepID=UPI001D0CBBC5|nr:hypothetical protein [Roseitranquillus sediminis]
MAALDTARKNGQYEYPLDLGTTKARDIPMLSCRSCGPTAAASSTAKPTAIPFGKWGHRLFDEGYAPGTSELPSDQERGFIDGRFAFHWSDNWRAVATMEEGDDLVSLPAPDFGEGTYTGAGTAPGVRTSYGLETHEIELGGVGLRNSRLRVSSSLHRAAGAPRPRFPYQGIFIMPH